MPTTFSLTLHFPLPPSLPPTLVIQALHAYEPLIRPNPYLQNFRRLPVDMDEVVADPFFNSSSSSSSSSPPSPSSSSSSPAFPPAAANSQEHNDDNDIASYEIHDRIPVVGFLGIYKDTIFPATFQTTPGGVKVKVDAAMGVKVRSVYEVCPAKNNNNNNKKKSNHNQEDEAAAAGGGGGGGGLEPPKAQQQQQQQLGAGGEEHEDHLWELVERSHVECGALLKPFVMKSFEAAHRDLCRKVLDNVIASAAGMPGTTDKELPPLPPDEAGR